jgi:hypothetical protein
VNRKVLFGIAALSALLLGGWLLQYYSDEAVIQRRFHELSQEISKDGKETAMALALKMRPVKEFLAPECEVLVPERRYRETIESSLAIRYLISYRERHPLLQISMEEFQVEFPSKNSAKAAVLFNVVTDPKQADTADTGYALQFTLQKSEKEWLMHQAVIPERLLSL